MPARVPLPDRNSRLFLIACVRRVVREDDDPCVRRAVEAAEQYADGAMDFPAFQVILNDLFYWRHKLPPVRHAAAIESALSAPGNYPTAVSRQCYALADAFADLARESAAAEALATEGDASGLPAQCVGTTTVFVQRSDALDAFAKLAGQEERRLQNALEACIVGPLTRGGVPFSWLRSSDHPILSLARTIDVERRYEEMPILGDALEEIGCRDDFLLAHCRRHPLHGHGCWVLERIFEAGRAVG